MCTPPEFTSWRAPLPARMERVTKRVMRNVRMKARKQRSRGSFPGSTTLRSHQLLIVHSASAVRGSPGRLGDSGRSDAVPVVVHSGRGLLGGCTPLAQIVEQQGEAHAGV